MSSVVSRVILVRHGQIDWNRVERFRGRHDIPLNRTGLKQAEAVAERIAAGVRPRAILTSPLSRALKAVHEACARRPWGPSDSIVMVSHTVMNRLILLGVLDTPLYRFWSLRQDPCAINMIEFDGSAFVLEAMNDTCHLPANA